MLRVLLAEVLLAVWLLVLVQWLVVLVLEATYACVPDPVTLVVVVTWPYLVVAQVLDVMAALW